MGRLRVIAGLELGHSGFRLVAGEDGRILGSTRVKVFDNMKNGMVINLDNATEDIAKAAEELTQKTAKRINSVFVNISGINVRSELANPVMTLPQRGCEITQRHMKELIESSKIISVPLDRQLLYITALDYKVDGQAGIKIPLGLYGSRFEATLLLVTAPLNQTQNIIKAVNYAGLEARELVLTSLAAAHYVLSEEETRRGVLMIDLKTDFTEIAIFKNGALLFFDTIPKGQRDITDAISRALNVPFEIAEELKKRYGFLDIGQVPGGRGQEIIPLAWMGAKQNILRGELNQIIKEQLGIIFDLIANSGVKGYKNFSNIVKAGAVITGGAASMEGFLEWAAQRLGFSARQGGLRPDIGYLDQDDLVISAGLLRFGFLKINETDNGVKTKFMRRIFQKAGELLSDYF